MEAELSIPEAVLLGHALMAGIAESLGIRAFFIKGPASLIQGLRLPRTSGDVDVFVAPQDLESMVNALRKRGWRERPVDPDNRTFQMHSITFDHANWPCCVDVHFRFPGMEHAAEDVFEVMWANTEVLELAGREVTVPSKVLGILILALHALRSPQLRANIRELEFLTVISEREQHAAALLNISGATGSLAAMRTFLQDLLPLRKSVVWPDATAEWRNLVMAKEPGSARLIALASAPLRDKPMMLFRSACPRPEAFLSRNIYADMSLSGTLRQHFVRWVRFVRAAPRIVRDFRQLRNG